MTPVTPTRASWRDTAGLALVGLRTWTPRQRVVAVGAALAVGLLIGWATVLIPNPVFSREIPPVWWNYPVWILTSALSGMLVATYVRSAAPDPDEARSSRLGMAGGVLAWFAVGCPVCNKLALLALGYSGAITWFAPVQPFLGLAALALTAVALVWRLRGQVACPAPPAAPAPAPEGAAR
ncbi:hypothetical protein [Isoptericola sediminis]|uniref:hypothetical protein n=1 Tax=Isoptericola sediminis TaxID=2733572 RepID=UPI0031B5774B